LMILAKIIYIHPVYLLRHIEIKGSRKASFFDAKNRSIVRLSFFIWQGKAINPVRENVNRKTIEKIGKKNIVKRT